MLCLVDMFLNRQSTYLWVQTVPLPRRFVLLSAWGRFHTGASEENQKKLARSFNFTFRYIDDILSLNNVKFDDFVDRIYPIELEIKDTIDTARSASYLDLYHRYSKVCFIPWPIPQIQQGLLHTLTYTIDTARSDSYLDLYHRYSKVCFIPWPMP